MACVEKKEKIMVYFREIFLEMSDNQETFVVKFKDMSMRKLRFGKLK